MGLNTGLLIHRSVSSENQFTWREPPNASGRLTSHSTQRGSTGIFMTRFPSTANPYMRISLWPPTSPVVYKSESPKKDLIFFYLFASSSCGYIWVIKSQGTFEELSSIAVVVLVVLWPFGVRTWQNSEYHSHVSIYSLCFVKDNMLAKSSYSCNKCSHSQMYPCFWSHDKPTNVILLETPLWSSPTRDKGTLLLVAVATPATAPTCIFNVSLWRGSLLLIKDHKQAVIYCLIRTDTVS